MDGIHYLVDSEGRKKAVQIDLQKHGALWDDFHDILVADSRKNEPRVSFEAVKKRLQRGAVQERRRPDDLVTTLEGEDARRFLDELEHPKRNKALERTIARARRFEITCAECRKARLEGRAPILKPRPVKRTARKR
jgi:hypothetical protein